MKTKHYSEVLSAFENDVQITIPDRLYFVMYQFKEWQCIRFLEITKMAEERELARFYQRLLRSPLMFQQFGRVKMECAR